MAEPNYDNNYFEWKNWNESEFGAFDRSAGAYFDSEINRVFGNKEMKIRVLEIGFGNGQFLEYARRKGWEVTGVEINPEAVMRAQEKGFDAQHTDKLAELQNEYFHLAVMFDVLEHVEVGEAIELLKHLRALLRRDGKILLRFPNGDSPFSLPLQNGDATHINYIGTNKIRFMSAQSGLEVEGIFSQARAIRGSRPIEAIAKLLIIMCQAAINKIVSWAFYGGNHIFFSSLNLTVILRQKP